MLCLLGEGIANVLTILLSLLSNLRHVVLIFLLGDESFIQHLLLELQLPVPVVVHFGVSHCTLQVSQPIRLLLCVLLQKCLVQGLLSLERVATGSTDDLQSLTLIVNLGFYLLLLIFPVGCELAVHALLLQSYLVSSPRLFHHLQRLMQLLLLLFTLVVGFVYRTVEGHVLHFLLLRLRGIRIVTGLSHAGDVGLLILISAIMIVLLSNQPLLVGLLGLQVCLLAVGLGEILCFLLAFSSLCCFLALCCGCLSGTLLCLFLVDGWSGG